MALTMAFTKIMVGVRRRLKQSRVSEFDADEHILYMTIYVVYASSVLYSFAFSNDNITHILILNKKINVL